MFDEVPDVEPVDVEIVLAAERFAVGHVVEAEQPASGRHVIVVARVAIENETRSARLIRLDAENIEYLIIELRLAANREVLVDALHANEPVALDAVKVAGDNRAQLGVGLQ